MILRDFHAKIMAEEFRKLTFPNKLTLAKAVGMDAIGDGDDGDGKAANTAVVQPDGTMVGKAVGKGNKLQDPEPMEDILNSFVDMGDEELRALTQGMNEGEITLHLTAAKAHPEYQRYQQHIKDAVGDTEKDMREHIATWYKFLQKGNKRFPEGLNLSPSTVQTSHADYLNSFVNMGEEKRREVFQAMEVSEMMSVHISAAKAHPKCKSYETYVIEVYGAEDDYVLAAPEGDVLEDVLGWYQYLEENKFMFSDDLGEAAIP